VVPVGFEYLEGEIASATIHSGGPVQIDTQGSHSTLATVVQTPHGIEA
jgi:hypothetical protein